MKNLPKITIPKINITDKNRNWILGGMLLAIFLADYFLFMQPFQIKTMMNLKPKIDRMRIDLKQAKIDIPKTAFYKEELKKVRVQMDAYADKILSKDRIPVILDHISRLASATDVRINQIMPMKDSQRLILENEDGKYYSLPILIDANGGYHNIGLFFDRIEKDNILMKIANFDIIGDSEDPKRHTTKVTIRTFTFEKEKQ